ncbi:hypothetical protein ASPVEDRAFT_145028 [Aspergillus versicolor CBS 583.65]|uniref:Carrier domain-containing protein n=1 Tax=Aspergillus versicolor CBS 583.65 TaxID=1036611 RepID=A0A1L9Q4Y1_ASPVE|nr:uncharacterized protein ASPVEDRAFT_145028 [Aspergillus versicolor CBS 583.65]OJJ08781.1 hypothetical protein ASPVEDRAFT_145028 [Aspergillus versicolor CBS 583.65]
MESEPPSDGACLFPTRSHGHDRGGDSRQLNATQVGCDAYREVAGYCDEHGVEIGRLLMGTWAIILKQFTDTETIHMGFQKTAKACEIGAKSRMEVASSSFGRDTPLRELLDSGRWTTAEAETASFNTGVAMCSQGIVPTTEGISVTEENNTCDVVLAWQAGSSSGPPGLWIRYKAGVLCSESAVHVADSVSHIITCIIQGEALDNSSAISGFSMNQRAKINEWNTDKAGSRASSPSLHAAIHQRYMEDPEKPAICWLDGKLTYSELMDASRRWAFKLQELGAGPGAMVPVCFEKSLWAIVAMLAINRVGAAFVPLDPSHPPDYLSGIIGMVNPPLILVSPLQEKLLGRILPCSLVVDEASTGELPHYGTGTFLAGASDYAADPAYCLFTSGSTGTPKGCVVSHAALASVAGHTTALHLDRSSRALQFASFSFGVSLIEVWCTLCAGGTVCIPSDADRLDRLATTISMLQADWAVLTPTILDLLQPETAPGLKTIVVAGEPLRDAQKSLWVGYTQLFQAYGLTEWAGTFSVSPQIRADDKSASIGAPVCGSAWLVDSHDPDQLVAIGVVGELVIEGPSLAQGYLQNPHKTALSFITDPAWALDESISQQRKRRFYRTGDLAFYNSDGSLQHVGRKDLQVKIRGQRTPLSVIEHHLAHGDPSFSGAVVDAITLANEDQLRLAVFVPHAEKAVRPGQPQEEGRQKSLFGVPDMAFTAKTKAVKRRLTDQLPRYMVPDIFLCVDHLSVTVTGKIARRQLRDQASNLCIEELAALTGLAIAGSDTGPNTPKERAIRDLVTQVLSLPPHLVRMDYTFVGLGGDSVLAMKMAASARQRGLAISVKDIFDAPSIRALAANAKTSLQPTTRGGAIPPFSLVETEAIKTITQTAAELCHVSTQDIEDILPCTPLQEGMMALGQTNPGTYVARFICQINQEVDVDRLRSAWATVVAANSILRTRIIQTPGNRMHQVVIKEESPQWDTDHQWHDYLDNGRYTEMKLGGPLVRGALLKGPEDPLAVYLVLTMHHSVCDRWSAGIFLDALQAAFEGETIEKSSFAAFTKYISDSPQSQAREFWVKEFAGLEAEVFPALPSQAHHRPRPSESLHLQVTTEPPTGATMSSFIRLAWALGISQYTATTDTVFGVTVTGRNAPIDGIEKLPAPTISTVPLRVQIDLNRTVTEAVAAVQQKASEMIPFEQTGLQNIRRYSREASDACEFQSHLVVQPAWRDNAQSGGNVLRLVEDGASVQGGFASYAIVLLCSLTSTSNIHVTAEFDPDVIRPSIMQHILEHFRHVLQYLIAHPGAQLRDISLGAFDTAAIRRWGTAAPEIQPECVHEVIQERVAESPSACAVDACDGRLAYADLNGMSTRLSIQLSMQGIKRETLVPLCFEKSRWAVVAILAVMKAGAAFVLLDPSQPLQRLQDICSQADSPLVLASEKNAAFAASLKSTVVVVSQGTLHEHPLCLEQHRSPVIDPSTALYVVFTSGSTGTPKGVVIEHRSYHAGTKFHNKGHRMCPQSRVLQFASYAFDTSIIEMVSTLMAGACVCIPSDHDRENRLAQVVEELAVTHAYLTPSVARVLAQSCIHPFEVLILVGEPMAASDISHWTQHAQLMNEYGPAECSVCATLNHEVGLGSDARDIGTGVGAVCWVVDPENHDRLRPVGAPGELLIEGPIVGRGYLGNPTLTAEKFLDTPPAWLHDIRPDGARNRFYKTGDLVRYQGDGSLHYIGRNDTQVKLRGQRVELSEVENGVRSCMTEIVDLVAETFVPRGAAQGQACLVAFVCTEVQGQGITDTHPFASVTDEFHAQVRKCLEDLDKFLPRYMIPDVFIPLQQIPTNVSGKANRRLLRELGAKLSWLELATYQPKAEDRRTTMTSSEKALRDTWAPVLNMRAEDISVSDSFYHLGGDSMSAMQVVALARSKGLLTSVQDIIQHRSIAKIAQHRQSTDHQVPQLEEVPGTPFGLSPIQKMFFDMQPDPRQKFNQSFLLRLSSTITGKDLDCAARAVVTRHSMLRARFEQKPDGRWSQRVMPTAAGSYRCLVHTVPNAGEWGGIVAAAQDAINIERGPLFCLDLINAVGDEVQYLHLVIHLLVTDLASWRIIFSDLEAELRSPSATATVNLTRPLSFQVWCALQEQYTRNHLHPATVLSPEAMSRASWDPRPFWGVADCTNVMGDRTVEHFTVDSDLTQQLLGPMNDPLDTRPEELFHAVLLSAFVRVFPGRSEGPVFGVEGHGREPWDAGTDLSETVGWFSTIYPMSVPVSQSMSIIHVIRAVKETRRAVPPRKWWAYFTSRYLHPEGPMTLGLRHPMEIVLNYAGHYKQLQREDSLFISDHHSVLGPLSPGDGIQRIALFDINITVRGDCLDFEFIYNRRMSHQQQIKDWIGASREGLADACRTLAAY